MKHVGTTLIALLQKRPGPLLFQHSEFAQKVPCTGFLSQDAKFRTSPWLLEAYCAPPIQRLCQYPSESRRSLNFYQTESKFSSHQRIFLC